MALHEALMYKDFERARMIMADRKQRKGVGFASEEFMGRLPLHVAVAATAHVNENENDMRQ